MTTQDFAWHFTEKNRRYVWKEIKTESLSLLFSKKQLRVHFSCILKRNVSHFAQMHAEVLIQVQRTERTFWAFVPISVMPTKTKSFHTVCLADYSGDAHACCWFQFKQKYFFLISQKETSWSFMYNTSSLHPGHISTSHGTEKKTEQKNATGKPLSDSWEFAKWHSEFQRMISSLIMVCHARKIDTKTFKGCMSWEVALCSH